MLIMPLVIQNIENDDDRNYIEQLYLKYVRRMYAVAWRYGAVKDNVEDIVSDSLENLIYNIDKLRTKDEKKLHAYIFSVVKNKTLDANRKERINQDKLWPGAYEELDRVAGKETVEEQVLKLDMLKSVSSVIFGLPPIVQDVLRLKYQQGLSSYEIAQLTGLSENQIWNYLRNAKHAIRKNIG